MPSLFGRSPPGSSPGKPQRAPELAIGIVPLELETTEAANKWVLDQAIKFRRSPLLSRFTNMPTEQGWYEEYVDRAKAGTTISDKGVPWDTYRIKAVLKAKYTAGGRRKTRRRLTRHRRTRRRVHRV